MSPGSGGRLGARKGQRYGAGGETRRLPVVATARRRPATGAHGGGERIPPPAFEALVCVRTSPDSGPADFAAYLRTEPAVAQVWRVAADIDAVVRLACRSLAELHDVVARMRHHGGAGHTVTYLVLPAGTGRAAIR